VVISGIHAEVAFVSHQKNPGTSRDVAVVVNIHQDMIFDDLLLDPGVKHRNQVSQLQLRGLVEEAFDTQALQFQFLLPPLLNRWSGGRS
jgi:hypothetical protein